MKFNKLLIIPLSVITTLTLFGCNSTQSDSTSQEVKQTGYYIVPDSAYMIGDYISVNDGYTLAFTYSDGSIEEHSGLSATSLRYIKSPEGEYHLTSNAFNEPGVYNAYIKVKYNDVTYTDESAYITVKSGLESSYDLLSFSITNQGTYFAGSYIKDVFDATIVLNWTALGTEYATYQDYSDYFSLKLYKGSDSSTDVSNEALENNQSYTVELTYGELSENFTFVPSTGIKQVSNEDLTILASDVDNDYAPSKGEVKVLVIPITLTLSDDVTFNYLETWDSSHLKTLQTNYFASTKLQVTFKDYYERASLDQMEVSGMVSDPYEETDSRYTADKIEEDDSFASLFAVINRAITYIEENNPDVDWSSYDLNDDGCLDNVHLITNFNTTKYSTYTKNDVWATPLWPHMWETGNTGTLDKPAANVYSISAINHVTDAITAIHEQGHIFGLDDYYDYSYVADYIGCADMESYNMFDWNSFSKLTQGWISPYVVTGESNSVTLSMKAASSSGQCLVVPADYSTWNGSAYDEYFIIELFSPYENNADWWLAYDESYTLGDYGVRVYHVDARLTANGKETDDPTNATWGCNNTANWEDSNGGNKAWSDFPLIALVSATGVNRFRISASYLTESDLFHEGDTFTFDEYSSFLSKSGKEVTTMDNGETFPYTITFDEMSKNSVTLTISK